MKITYALSLFLIFTLSCKTSQNIEFDKASLKNYKISDNLTLGVLDSITQAAIDISSVRDSFAFGKGRKIIYRDISAAKSATLVSGDIKVIVCINREGIATYAEVQQDSSSIKDRLVLKNHLRSAAKYKFEPQIDAPEVQCGKITYTITNSRNKKASKK